MLKAVIIEDSYLIRLELQKILSLAGIETYATHDCHLAIENLDSTTNWLIINPILTSNSGLELLYEVNSWPDLRNIKVIILTYSINNWDKYKLTFKELNVHKIFEYHNFKFQQLSNFLKSH